jgi:hypothetical protein
LQKMVLDLMAQSDRESAERQKIDAMLRELLDAGRNRKSEQLSVDQLALFAGACTAGSRGALGGTVRCRNSRGRVTSANRRCAHRPSNWAARGDPDLAYQLTSRHRPE